MPAMQNTRMTVTMMRMRKMMMKLKNWGVMKMILMKMDKNIWRSWLNKLVRMEMMKIGKKMMLRRLLWKAIPQSSMMKTTLLMSIKSLKLYFKLFKIAILYGIRL
eukprot:TRINITY_DN48033_c0_g1_i1.p3 TRINITY_DN48033_c0_g1~~TRINITY_DN48033_c0_g1_i1.p3  ORF type:complete len:105 (+),score=9.30 TRINITY_DN48033_c0_g1_i1:280-594(+)